MRLEFCPSQYAGNLIAMARSIHRRLVLFALFALLSVAAAWMTMSHTMHAGPVINHGELALHAPWSRATAPGAPGVGYLRIVNNGSESDRLVAGSGSGFDVQLHSMEMDEGVMKMRPLENGREIPAGAELTLEPGGDHLMLMQLPNPLTEGKPVTLELEFEKAGTITLDFNVLAAGAQNAHQH